MTNEKRTMERIGLFSEPGYTTISDPYGKKETVFRGKPPQDKGLKPLQIPGNITIVRVYWEAVDPPNLKIRRGRDYFFAPSNILFNGGKKYQFTTPLTKFSRTCQTLICTSIFLQIDAPDKSLFC